MTGESNPTNPGARPRHALAAQEALWTEALRLADVVTEMVTLAVRALLHGDAEAADRVAALEHEVNDRDVDIEAECLRILALYDPVASDLRRLIGVLRLDGRLERIGDLAAKLANRGLRRAAEPDPVPFPDGLGPLVESAGTAVVSALNALRRLDAEAARAVIAADPEIDRLRREVTSTLKECIRCDPARVSAWLRLVNAARNLERIADHASGVAGLVVYIKEGAVVRHGTQFPVD